MISVHGHMTVVRDHCTMSHNIC